MKPTAVNLTNKLSQFSDHWSPKIVSQFNGNDIMVVKVQGEFVWHDHPDTDDFFLVLDGEVTIETEDGNVSLVQESFTLCRKAKNIVRWPRRKRIFCLSNQAARQTQAMKEPQL